MHPIIESKETLKAHSSNVIPFNQTVAVSGTLSGDKILLAEWRTRFWQAVRDGRLVIAEADGTFQEFDDLMQRTDKQCSGFTLKIEG